MKALRLTVFLFGILLIGRSGFAAEESKKIDLRPIEELTVHSGGRAKPFLSFAREVTVFITGKETFEGKGAVELLMEWLVQPEAWEKKALIPVSYKPLRESLGAPKDKRLSPEFLSSHQLFLEKAAESQERSDNGETLLPMETKLLELYQKVNLFYNTAEGKSWQIVPSPAGPDEPWMSAADMKAAPILSSVAAPFAAMIEAYRAGDVETFQERARTFVTALGSPKASKVELQYERMRFFRWAWRLYLLAVMGFLLNFMFKQNALSGVSFTALFSAFILHTYGFILRSIIAGRPPVTNMYESVVWVSWGVVFFSLALLIFYRSFYLGLASSGVATLGLILADSFPAVLDPSISPLVPVLRNNYWLTIHVLTITLSYAAFALALGLGHVSLWFHAFQPEKEILLKNLTGFLYRALQIGVIFLSAGTILGGVWANYSWGRFWGWDPKETWALIALLGYLAILHCRYAGWLTPVGLAFGSVAAFLGILMAWYGVNYVLAAGLHSYGFGGGGVQYVALFVLADLLLAGILALVSRKKNSLAASR